MRFEVPRNFFTVNINLHFWRLTAKKTLFWRLLLKFLVFWDPRADVGLRRKKAKAMNMLECKKEITLLLSITFDWLKQQKLTKLHGKVRMNIYTVLTNIHITKSRLSLNDTEILCGGHVKLSTFLGFFYNSYKWSKSIKTHTQKTFQNGV